MDNISLYPMRLSPVLKTYLWGGRRLKNILRTKEDKIAESWMLSAHEDGHTKVENGYLAGMKIGDIISSDTKKYLGSNKYNMLPLIVKLIDAEKALSIQIHPTSDNLTKENLKEQEKTELWYVLDCHPDSTIYYGFKEDLDEATFLEYLKRGKVCDLLNKIKVQKGDLIYIPSGTIHGLGMGITVVEIQQSSNTTYRIYDYLRKDSSGDLRPLHIEKALEHLDFKGIKPLVSSFSNSSSPFKCEYFCVNKIEVDKIYNSISDGKSFHSLIFLEGKGNILVEEKFYDFKAGDSFFIPANLFNYTINGHCTCLIISI